MRKIWILVITSVGNAILKLLFRKSFNLLKFNLFLFIFEIIYIIITRTFLILF